MPERDANQHATATSEYDDRVCRHGIVFTTHCKECALAGFCGCLKCRTEDDVATLRRGKHDSPGCNCRRCRKHREALDRVSAAAYRWLYDATLGRRDA